MKTIEELKEKYIELDGRTKELSNKFLKTLSENIALYKKVSDLEKENKRLKELIEQYKASKIIKFTK